MVDMLKLSTDSKSQPVYNTLLPTHSGEVDMVSAARRGGRNDARNEKVEVRKCGAVPCCSLFLGGA
eukprot:4354470-Lingulodinium_polyedra.AAC.1